MITSQPTGDPKIDTETDARNIVQTVRKFNEHYLTNNKNNFSDWFQKQDKQRRNDLPKVKDKATWFLAQDICLVALFKSYFKDNSINPAHPDVEVMEGWRYGHTVPILFWWMREYGNSDGFNHWLKSTGKPYKEKKSKYDLLQTFYELDQLMLDYNVSSKELDSASWYEVGLVTRHKSQKQWVKPAKGWVSSWLGESGEAPDACTENPYHVLWGESDEAPDACTGNPYHVPLD